MTSKWKTTRKTTNELHSRRKSQPFSVTTVQKCAALCAALSTDQIDALLFAQAQLPQRPAEFVNDVNDIFQLTFKGHSKRTQPKNTMWGGP